MRIAGSEGTEERIGPPRAATVLTWAPVAAWALMAAFGIWWRTGYYYVVAEDRAFEWIQVSAFAVAAGACFALAASLRRSNVVAAVVAALGGALFVVVVGEELAWGQRLFGVSVPAIERVNRQGDVSLHNIGAGLTLSQMGTLGMALTGLLARPVVEWWSRRRDRDAPSALLPPRFLASWFALTAAYTTWRLLVAPIPSHRVAKFSEVAELTVALAAAIATVKAARAVRASRPGALADPLTEIIRRRPAD